ncbi:hypothetical protein C8Q75DRAFT_738970 [Abortiporus biennis]|nr:hypothetical protein C8Q75DRAFT_738970 [Abortiporus biennis]
MCTSLPNELWLIIFRFATVSPSTINLQSSSYTPFQSIPHNLRDEALGVKSNLSRVCKLWRQLLGEMMYEDVVLLKSNAAMLRKLLQDELEATGSNRNSVVRRICLPYSTVTTTRFTSQSTDVLEFLRHSPNLKVLVRPNITTDMHIVPSEYLVFDFPAEECPQLLSLVRLDWWHHNEATRTGGINSLINVLQEAPNLQYLSLGGDIWLASMRTSPVQLLHLTTLRLRRVNVLFIQQVCQWSLPSLKHFIVDTVHDLSVLGSFWAHFGEQLHSVELGKSLRFYVNDILHVVLQGCPNLKELNYYIMFTSKASQPISHLALQTIRLHNHPNALFDATSFLEHLETHFTMYAQEDFPNLRRIVLYGGWDITHDERYRQMSRKLHDKGCSIELFG